PGMPGKEPDPFGSAAKMLFDGGGAEQVIADASEEAERALRNSVSRQLEESPGAESGPFSERTHQVGAGDNVSDNRTRFFSNPKSLINPATYERRSNECRPPVTVSSMTRVAALGS